MLKIMIQIYTDGAVKGNPGRGGYGVVLISEKHNLIKEYSKGFRKTTNNRMELMAAIKGLKELKQNNTVVTIYSDSKYVVDSVNKGWCFKWLRNKELEQDGIIEPRVNSDLWKIFIELYNKHKVTMTWVKGHNGNKYNEVADQLASNAALSEKLLVDIYYEEVECLKNNI